MGDAEHHEEKQHRWGWENAIVGGGVCVGVCVCVVCAAHRLIQSDGRIGELWVETWGKGVSSGTPGSSWLYPWG